MTDFFKTQRPLLYHLTAAACTCIQCTNFSSDNWDMSILQEVHKGTRLPAANLWPISLWKTIYPLESFTGQYLWYILVQPREQPAHQRRSWSFRPLYGLNALEKLLLIAIQSTQKRPTAAHCSLLRRASDASTTAAV